MSRLSTIINWRIGIYDNEKTLSLQYKIYILYCLMTDSLLIVKNSLQADHSTIFNISFVNLQILNEKGAMISTYNFIRNNV